MGWLRTWARRVLLGGFHAIPRFARFALWGRWQDPPRHVPRNWAPLEPMRRDFASCVGGAGALRTVCFLPTHVWASSAFQRPQQMAQAFADIGLNVIYCERWRTDRYLAASTKQTGPAAVGMRHLGPRLHLFRAPEEVVGECLAEHPPDCVTFLWPEQADGLPAGLPSTTIYEIVDDHSLLGKVPDKWQRRHRHWLRTADIVVGTADDLVGQLRPVRPDALLLPNAVRLEDWARSATPPVPQDLIAARQARVVVGYYGALAEWLDWDMWERAADSRPHWSFVLIGYACKGSPAWVQRQAANRRNMWYLGRKPYGELRSYLAHLDVATIPFLLNPITHACSPVKLFEYMAAGKPIVSTAMREVLKYRSVLVAHDAGSFVARIEDALRLRGDPAYRAVLQQEAEANTWTARCRDLVAAMERSPANRRVASAESSATRVDV
jgi:glycosyltransferase involved in cell wall biosynthesis